MSVRPGEGLIIAPVPATTPAAILITGWRNQGCRGEFSKLRGHRFRQPPAQLENRLDGALIALPPHYRLEITRGQCRRPIAESHEPGAQIALQIAQVGTVQVTGKGRVVGASRLCLARILDRAQPPMEPR